MKSELEELKKWIETAETHIARGDVRPIEPWRKRELERKHGKGCILLGPFVIRKIR